MASEYSTKQRSFILDFLKENSAHVTVRDIIEHLGRQGIHVGTATVYRTLDRLCKQGVVKKFVIDERSGACFQYVHGVECNEHFHLKCLNCGRLIHMNCGFLKRMEEHIFNDHGFTVSSGSTVIYGLCSECNGNEREGVEKEHSCGCHEH